LKDTIGCKSKVPTLRTGIAPAAPDAAHKAALLSLLVFFVTHYSVESLPEAVRVDRPYQQNHARTSYVQKADST